MSEGGVRPPLRLEVDLVPEQTGDDAPADDERGRTRDEYVRERPPHHGG